MVLGKVMGTMVATQKDESLVGITLLIVQAVDFELKPLSSFTVAADSVGAGVGEIVLCANGSSARLTQVTRDKPVDSVVMAIVDSFEIEGTVRYRKHE